MHTFARPAEQPHSLAPSRELSTTPRRPAIVSSTTTEIVGACVTSRSSLLARYSCLVMLRAHVAPRRALPAGRRRTHRCDVYARRPRVSHSRASVPLVSLVAPVPAVPLSHEHDAREVLCVLVAQLDRRVQPRGRTIRRREEAPVLRVRHDRLRVAGALEVPALVEAVVERLKVDVVRGRKRPRDPGALFVCRSYASRTKAETGRLSM